MNMENQPTHKERDRPPPPSQNLTTSQNPNHHCSSLGIAWLRKSMENLLSTAKTIDMYDYLKPIQRDFKQEIFVLHNETNHLPLNKSPKEISEDIVTLTESIKTY